MASDKRCKRKLIGTVVGVLFCASAALIASYLFHAHGTAPTMVPIVFLGIVTAVALRYGIAAGIAGSLVSAVIFAYFLFTPGSIRVQSSSARTSLGWLLLGGVALSVLFAPQDFGERTK